jgi:phage-related minor tail protein
MKLENLLDQIPAEHRSAFAVFLETGEASPEFLDFMDANPECQRVVDIAMTHQASALRGFVQALAQAPRGEKTTESIANSASIASDMLAATLGEVLHFSPDVRHRVVEGAVAQLARAETPGDREEAKKLIEQLDRSARSGI